MSLAKMIVIGYIAKLEPFFSKDGVKFLKFSIPVKVKDETDWFNCIVYGDERCDKLNWLAKGMFACVRGTEKLNYSNEKIWRTVFVDDIQAGGKADDVEVPDVNFDEQSEIPF
jgi:hypothetical protein